MDKEKRKQLQEAYKNRKPQMGVIAFTCKRDRRKLSVRLC